MPDLVSHYRDAGFSDDEISAYLNEQRTQYKAAGFSDAEVDAHFGVPPTPATVPPAYVDRLKDGLDLGATIKRIGGKIAEGFGDEPIGMSPENVAEMQRLGIYRDPSTGRGGPLRLANEAVMQPTIAAVDTIFRGINAGIYGIGAIAEEIARGYESEGQAGRVGRDVTQMLQIAPMLHAPMAKPVVDEVGKVTDRTVANGLPRGQDFSDAGTALGRGDTTPAMEGKLADLWEQRGIHPAEVVHDAQTDVTITQAILSSDRGDLPAAYIEAQHASPYKFEAFGPVAEHGRTGEGAMTIAHGTYLSTDPGVHRYYMRQFGSEEFSPKAYDDPILGPRMHTADDAYAQASEAYRKAFHSGDPVATADALANAEAAIQKQTAVRAEAMAQYPSAHSYRVRINVNPEHLLDYDKPLSEQSPHVQAAVRGLEGALRRERPLPDLEWTERTQADTLGNRAGEREIVLAERGKEVTQFTASYAGIRETPSGKFRVQSDSFNKSFDTLAEAKKGAEDYIRKSRALEAANEANATGSRILSNLEEALGSDAAASAALHEAGIPGVRYQDASHGASGEPSHNYVIFDHRDIEITHRNGEPVTPKQKADILAERAGGGVPPGGEPPRPPGEPPSAGTPGERPPSYSDAEKQILSRISIGETSPTRRATLNDLYTNFIDKLFPISRAVKRADLADLKAEDNPYNLARLLSGHVGKADHFLNQGTFDFGTYENNGASLKAILAPVKDDLNGFRAYAAAARALELEGRSIQSGFDTGAPSAPPLVSSGLEAARTVVREGKDRFAQPFIDLVDYQNRVTQYLRDSGVLSDAGYAAMVEANKLYVPFSRVMGIDETAQARGGSTLQATNPVRKIKGSARAIVDPIESVVRNTYHFIEMAEKNQVGTKLVDMLKRAQEELPEAPAAAVATAGRDTPRAAAIGEALGEVGIRRPDELAEALAHATEPRRDGEIAILRDGKRETYSVDPDLARAMKGLDAQSMGILERVIAFPARVLRAGAVLTPDFQIRHTIRDFLYATTTFKGGVFTPIDMVKGFTGLIMKDADYWNWLKGGGGNVSFVGMDRQYLQADLRKLTGETGLVGRAWNVLADPEASMWDRTGAVGKLPFQAIDKFVLDPLRVATAFAESASHLAAFKKTMRASERAGPEPANLREQVIRAAWESRDTAVDAARMGANMRAYNMITAFANIKLQDTDRVVRAIKDNPIATITKIGAAITVPSMILWAANHDDPRYAEIPQWQRDLFFIVMTPEHVFRLPKPWAMGVIFGSGPERLLDAYVAHKPDAFRDFFKSLWHTSGPDFLPTAAAPIVDQFANRSTFTDRTLIPHEMEKYLPEYQYTPYTTELTKALGKIVGAFPGMQQLKLDHSGWGGTARALTSPILMENYIRGWTGTLGTYALQAADAALRKTGNLPDPPLPASTLADIPVVRAFVVRYPTASAESIQLFYDAYESNKKYYDTWIAKAKDGDFAAVQHIQDMGGPMMFVQLDGIKQTLSQHSQIIRDIYKNPTVPPAEKRQLIDQLYFSMIQVGRAGMDTIRDMRRQSEAQAPASAIPQPVANQPIIVPPIQAPGAVPSPRRLGNGSTSGVYAP